MNAVSLVNQLGIRIERRPTTSVAMQIAAVLLALVVSFLVSASLIHFAGADVVKAFILLFKGAFGSPKAFINSLVQADAPDSHRSRDGGRVSRQNLEHRPGRPGICRRHDGLLGNAIYGRSAAERRDPSHYSLRILGRRGVGWNGGHPAREVSRERDNFDGVVELHRALPALLSSFRTVARTRRGTTHSRPRWRRPASIRRL